jgi:hypothetical protein
MSNAIAMNLGDFPQDEPASHKILAAVATSDEEHEKKMKDARAHNGGHTMASSFALAFALVCLVGGLWWNIRGEVRLSALAETSPVTYSGKWEPMKKVYHPGEIAYFRFSRTASFSDESLYIVSVMAFEDADNGVNYPGGIGVRMLNRNDEGYKITYATRRIPADALPGKRYHLVGLVLSQSEHRTLPIGIDSDYFEVRNYGSEQEKAAADKRRGEEKPSDLPIEGFTSKGP